MRRHPEPGFWGPILHEDKLAYVNAYLQLKRDGQAVEPIGVERDACPFDPRDVGGEA